MAPQVGFEPDNPSIHSMNSRTRESVSVPLVNPALLGSPGTYTAKVSMTGGATMQAIRCQLLDRAQVALRVARDPAGGGGIDGADVLSGGDGRTAQVGIAFADGAQGPVHGLLDQVAWVGGGASDQRQQRREIFVRRVIGLGGGLNGQARHEPESGAADELALG